CWVLGEHNQGTNTVANGPLAGRNLADLRHEYGANLLGTREVQGLGGRCPLLIKLLDATDDLSVQVHPSDDYEGLAPGEPGKTEMWYVLGAEPGSQIVYGLKEGVDRAAFETAVRAGHTMDCLKKITVQPGDVYYVPAGTIHALGAGVLVAEVQQSSDTVYRVYDYNRLGLDGKPRELHVEHALKVTNYDTPPKPFRPAPAPADQWQTLVESPFFMVERMALKSAWSGKVNPVSFETILVTAGKGRITWAEGKLDLAKGDSLLLPASLGDYSLSGEMELVRSYLP
ncbi:MAG: type I phosphomannose isomerase catalytic subunit, partial [Mycobacterium leprae]